jgi:hypothetical protein
MDLFSAMSDELTVTTKVIDDVLRHRCDGPPLRARTKTDPGTRAKLNEFIGLVSPVGNFYPLCFRVASARTTDNLETRDYDVTVGGHALKLHLLLLPDGRLEDATITDASTN